MTAFRMTPRSMPVQIYFELLQYPICYGNKGVSLSVNDVDPYVIFTLRCYFQHTFSIHT
jgi:hypothetical protein